jgi:putative phosphonate catabolism associated alcohol dehydrogenase
MSNLPVASEIRAAVLVVPGQPLELQAVPVPPLAEGELLVRVTACSLCGSDLHTAHGRRPHPVPTILGHEIVGRIAALGPGSAPVCVSGRPLAVGQRITWSVCASCGRCDRCLQGMPQKCRQLVKYGHSALQSPHGLSGGLADYVQVFAGTAIVPLPDTLTDTAAAPASCAVATAAAIVRTVRQQLRAFGPDGGSFARRSAVVLGGGMLGLSVASLLAAAGMRRLVLLDPVADRRTRAVATVPGLVAAAPPPQIDQAWVTSLLTTPGAERPSDGEAGRFEADGFDVVVEASGAVASIPAALALAATGGTCILAGSVSPTPGVAFDPERVVRRQLAVHGVHNYRPEDLVAAVEHLASPAGGPLGALAGPVFPIERVNEAMDLAATPDALRVVVTP